MGQGRAEQGRAGQGRAGKGRMRQGRVGWWQRESAANRGATGSGRKRQGVARSDRESNNLYRTHLELSLSPVLVRVGGKGKTTKKKR